MHNNPRDPIILEDYSFLLVPSSEIEHYSLKLSKKKLSFIVI